MTSHKRSLIEQVVATFDESSTQRSSLQDRLCVYIFPSLSNSGKWSGLGFRSAIQGSTYGRWYVPKALVIAKPKPTADPYFNARPNRPPED